MVRVAIVFLVFAPQAWSLNVSSVADEAPSLLQQAAMDVSVAETEEEVDSVGDGPESPPNQEEDDGLDETQPSADVDSISQLQHLEDLHEESTEESHEGLNETHLLGLTPEKGDAMPKPPKSFPGCGCDFQEDSKSWTCKGTIALPASVQGNKCCCCTLSCAKDNRCTDEQCLANGIDQRAEIAAEEARLNDLLKGASALFGELPVYKISLGQGRCSGLKIMNACKAKNMVPLCDTERFCQPGYGCYHPDCGKPRGEWKFYGHFSVPNHHITYKYGTDPMQMYGIAMYNKFDGPLGGALIANANGHQWCSQVNDVRIYQAGKNVLVRSIPIGQIDSGAVLGGWHTYCVKEQATESRTK